MTAARRAPWDVWCPSPPGWGWSNWEAARSRSRATLGAHKSCSFKQAGSAVSVSITLSKSSPVDVSASVTGTLQNFFTAGAITVKKSHLSSAKMKMVGLNGHFTLSYELKPLTAFGLGSAGGFKLTLPAGGQRTLRRRGDPLLRGGEDRVLRRRGVQQQEPVDKGQLHSELRRQRRLQHLERRRHERVRGVVQGIGKVLLDQANAILSGPITLVLGAQIPQLEVGIGVKGLNVAGFVDVVADTAIKVGGNTPGLGPSTGGCDACDLKVLVTAGAKASFFGFSTNLVNPVTLFSKDFIASYPPACGTVRGLSTCCRSPHDDQHVSHGYAHGDVRCSIEAPGGSRERARPGGTVS